MSMAFAAQSLLAALGSVAPAHLFLHDSAQATLGLLGGQGSGGGVVAASESVPEETLALLGELHRRLGEVLQRRGGGKSKLPPHSGRRSGESRPTPLRRRRVEAEVLPPQQRGSPQWIMKHHTALRVLCPRCGEWSSKFSCTCGSA